MAPAFCEAMACFIFLVLCGGNHKGIRRKILKKTLAKLGLLCYTTLV